MSSRAAASALDVLSGAANGAQPVAAGATDAGREADVDEPRRAAQLDLSRAAGGGTGVMASGLKRSRTLMEPSRSVSSAGSESVYDSEAQRG